MLGYAGAPREASLCAYINNYSTVLQLLSTEVLQLLIYCGDVWHVWRNLKEVTYCLLLKVEK